MATQKLKKVTIKDIAKVCNVSTQTVSRVINKRPDVAPETRKTVEKVIAELDYQPSALARSLVRQRSYTLGIITAGLNYVGVSQTLHAITDQCEAANYALLIKELPRFDTTNIVPIIEALMARHVEGIIFGAPELNDNIKKVQSQLPISCPPIVFLKSQFNPDYPTISIDNYNGARTAVNYLLSVGKRHIGHITGPLEWLEARQRKQGWEEALRDAGYIVSDQNWEAGNWSSASGYAAFANLIQKYPKVDAIFASNDQMALGAIHYAHANGIQIPNDLAVIGFDNLAESAFFTPALTTINQPLRELGIVGVKTLLTLIEGDEPNFPDNSLTIQTDLVIRDTTPK